MYENNIKLDLLIIILILFAFDHLFTLISSDSSFNDICSAEMLFMGQAKVIPSANKIKRKNSEQLEKSFIKIRNNNGPSTEPCEIL